MTMAPDPGNKPLTRDARLFVAGNYPAKGVSVTEADLQKLADGTNAAGGCDLIHTHADPELKFGKVHDLVVKGKELWSKITIDPEATDVVERSGLKTLSVAFMPSLKDRLTEVSLTGKPHIPAAQMFSDHEPVYFTMGTDVPEHKEGKPVKFKDMLRGLLIKAGNTEEDATKVLETADFSDLIPAPAPVKDPDALAKFAEMEAEIAALKASKIASEASAFSDSEIAAGRAFPAEKPAMIAAFTQAANDDAKTPVVVTFGDGDSGKGSRVDALKALYASRPNFALFSESKPSDLKELEVLFNAQRTKKAGEPADKLTAERRKELLGHTPEGRAALAASK